MKPDKKPKLKQLKMIEKYDLTLLRDLITDTDLGFIDDALSKAEKNGIKLGKDIGARAIGKVFLDHWELLRTLHKDEFILQASLQKWIRLKAELSK